MAVAHGLSCLEACGISPDHGSNPCPLHWQAGPPGKPCPDSKDEQMLAWRMVGHREESVLGRRGSG